jgi:hypothetical protein
MIDLNNLHRAIHQVTGSMALRFNRATPADLMKWAEMLRAVAVEMEATAAIDSKNQEKTEQLIGANN